MTDLDHVILVDEYDKPVGEAEKLKAHQEGLLHRAFSIFILKKNESGFEILLQQRHPEKYHCGGLWSNTCCSHPRKGETTLAAAKRRLQEELGINTPLYPIDAFIYKATLENGLTEHEFDHVIIGFIKEDISFEHHPKEISDTRWAPLDSILEEYEHQKEHFTPWFKEALMLLLNHQDTINHHYHSDFLKDHHHA